MDECLHEILKTCNQLPGNKQYSSPKEAVNHVISTHIIEKDSCYDPEAEDVLTILSHVVSVLTPIYSDFHDFHQYPFVISVFVELMIHNVHWSTLSVSQNILYLWDRYEWIYVFLKL